MSLGHISLVRIPAEGDRIAYEVRSPDFSAVPGDEVLIGHLFIDPAASTYTFSQGGELAGMRLVPPQVFELDDAAVMEKLQTEFKGCDAVLWMRRLSRVARFLMQQGNYPPRYP